MKQIDRVAVLGAGVMGASIAGHLANAGIEVLLLDIVLKEPDGAPRNGIALQALAGLTGSKPPPLHLPSYASWVEVGNLEDDLGRLRQCDWVIEAVVENMEIKKRLFTEKVVPNLKPGAILSTNTSGLSVNALAQALPGALRRNFLATHFFNPPRYMRLMELVGCAETDPDLIAFMASFLATRLGKGVVLAKDTPNFIANRIGTYAAAVAGRYMTEMGLTVEEVDAITGPAMARPKTATFALWDLVGIDTVARVVANCYESLVDDDEREVFRLPESMEKMVAAGLLGKKAKKGFYRWETVSGVDVRFYYDLQSESYQPCVSPRFASLLATGRISDPGLRVKTLLEGSDNAALFAWSTLRDTLIYAAKRIPEIADDVVSIDRAMKWGYNWELGPFEILDQLGVASFVSRAEKDGCVVAGYLKEVECFYKTEAGRDYFYSIPDREFRESARPATNISLLLLKGGGALVESNSAASVIDLGDGVFCLEFHSKMNTIGADTLAMIRKAIRRTEQDGVGLVIANEGPIFSAGANLMLLAMAIADRSFDDIALSVLSFQKTMMAIKYAKIPVVAAPHNLVMGGGCEICLHADAINPHAETYMGLVEIGVGLLPAGGGTKEMALRAILSAEETGADVMPFVLKNYRTIATGRVSTSAAELFGMGLMRQGDAITMDIAKRIHDAKQKVLALAANYRPGRPKAGLKAPGRGVAASIRAELWNLEEGGFLSAYDRYLASGIADVITGGDVPAGTLIDEQYLLDLEREMFVRFCGETKTVERIQHMLKKGKPLRN